MKKWFTLYWIPLFPTSDLGQYVECQSCKGTFNDRILSFDPKGSQEKFEAEFAIAAKRVMFKMALADGEVDQGEIDQIAQAFSNIVKREIAHEDIAAELETARNDTRSMQEFLQDVAPNLNDMGRELVLRSAIAVAKADGNVDDREVAELHEAALALELPKAYANGIFIEEGIQTITRLTA